MTENSSDLSDDIVPEEPRHASRERRFAPWHKVRKEYVRRNQWNRLIIRYAVRFLRRELQECVTDDWSADEGFEIPDSIRIHKPLNCLVIPGDDLLDVRSLCQDTQEINCYIRYLGFNSGQGSEQPDTRIHIAHNEVTSSQRVSDDSIVLHDSFQVVAKQKSQAYRYVKQLGPFHVVNLDLCDSLFPNQYGDVEAYFDGLHAISAYQMQEMATPWLLFITTEVAPKEVNVKLFTKLCKPTKMNLKHAEFQYALSKIVPVESLKSSEQVDLSTLNEQQLVDLFGVSVGKSLLGFCATAGASWKLEMRDSYTYAINTEKNVVMLSLAFQFTPISQPPEDPTGLSTLKFASPKPFDEAALAVKLVSSVQNITDIDAILESDAGLRQSLLQSSADLLDSAGYDRDSYLEWVRDGEQTA